MRTPTTPTARNRAMSSTAPMKPSSSATIAKMKSVCAYGRKPNLAMLGPMPLPGNPAVRGGDLRLDRLVAGVLWVLPRVHERHEPAEAIGLGHRRQHGQTGTRSEPADQRLHRHAADEEHDEHDRAEQDRGAEVR